MTKHINIIEKQRPERRQSRKETSRRITEERLNSHKILIFFLDFIDQLSVQIRINALIKLQQRSIDNFCCANSHVKQQVRRHLILVISEILSDRHRLKLRTVQDGRFDIIEQNPLASNSNY